MNVFESVFILFLIMGLGYAAKKANFLHHETRTVLSKFLVNVGLPFLILKNLNRSFDSESTKLAFLLLLLSVLSYLIVILISRLFVAKTNLTEKEIPAYQFGLVFPNVGFMGFPVIEAVLGGKGVFFAAIFNIPFEIFIWTYGVSVFQKEIKLHWKSIVTPNLIAIAVGLVMYFLKLRFPIVIQQPIDMLGSAASPLAMLTIGVMLTEMPLSSLFSEVRPFLMSLLRLVIIPLLLFGVLYVLGFREEALLVPTIIFAMPVAANGAIIATYYHKDFLSVTKFIIISTLLSLFTIPVLIIVLKTITEGV